MQKNTVLALATLIMGLAVIFLFLPRIMSPKIQIETTEYDFGNISQQKVEKVLWVKNIGKQTLEIKRVSTSCGCTTASIDKTSINPGESANMAITFDPNLMGEIGLVEKVVYVRSNDPANEEVAITIKMNVAAEKSPSPSPINTPAAFKCPKTTGGYIDCMPGPGFPLEKQKLCSGEYYQWIIKNCPDIDFAY